MTIPSRERPGLVITRPQMLAMRRPTLLHDKCLSCNEVLLGEVRGALSSQRGAKLRLQLRLQHLSVRRTPLRIVHQTYRHHPEDAAEDRPIKLTIAALQRSLSVCHLTLLGLVLHRPTRLRLSFHAPHHPPPATTAYRMCLTTISSLCLVNIKL